MSEFTPEVRERLVDIINDYLCPVGVTTRIDKKAVQAALDHIDALEARVAVLAARLKELRVACEGVNMDKVSDAIGLGFGPVLDAMERAAGALEGGRS